MRREFGDFQTPPALVDEILEKLSSLDVNWSRVLEPTCGVGNFIEGFIRRNTEGIELHGVEIYEEYIRNAQTLITRSGFPIHLSNRNIFDFNLNKDLDWNVQGPLLVIGNPPWVTNSELGGLDSRNLPQKKNFKKLNGLDAITGKSNFDITEYIWIKLVTELLDQTPVFAMLCKTSVARNILEFCYQNHIPFSNGKIFRIDAKKWFNASVDACLFYMRTQQNHHDYRIEVFPTLSDTTPEYTYGFINGRSVSNCELYNETKILDGVSPVEWRQGIKHDAAKVMELVREGDELKNGLGETVAVESGYLFPLLKSTDLYNNRLTPCRYVIVTQRGLNDSTLSIQEFAPKLWSYLNEHALYFDKRKSSIYRNKPKYSIFGIGDYTFSPYKIAVSALHKNVLFRAVPEYAGRPVIFDDTCYLLSFDSPEKTAIVTALLNHPLTKNFIDSIAHKDAKRPVTKQVLQRINYTEVLSLVDLDAVVDTANEYFAEIARLPALNLIHKDTVVELIQAPSLCRQEMLFS